MNFENLLEGKRKDLFIRHYFEQKPMVLSAFDVKGFPWILSSDTLNHLFSGWSSQYFKFFIPQNKVFELFEDPIFEIRCKEALHEYAKGKPLLFWNYKDFHSPMQELCYSLEKAFFCRETFGSVLLVPRNSEGFTFDIGITEKFYFQTSGELELEVFYSAGENIVDKKVMDITCKEGDLFFLPKHYRFEVKGKNKEAARVALIGFNSFTWGDLFNKVIEENHESSDFLQRTVPIEVLRSGELCKGPEGFEKEFKRTFEAFKYKMLEPKSFFHACVSLKEEQVVRSQPFHQGHIISLSRVNQMTLDSIILPIKTANFLMLKNSDSSMDMKTFDNYSIHFEKNAGMTLELISKMDSCKVRDFPGELNPEEKLQLGRRLLSCGLIEIGED
jgi:hypothetical protein